MNDQPTTNKPLLQDDAILNVGEVIAVQGRKIKILLRQNKNLSDLFYKGKLINNISVDGYVEIKKGFLNIIGKIDGEEIVEDYGRSVRQGSQIDYLDKNKRVINVSLVGYIGINRQFFGGTKEFPLIGDEAFILTSEKLHIIHQLSTNIEDRTITIGTEAKTNIQIDFPINKIFNSHLAVFGNTGSGKSNTLAKLYAEFLRTPPKNSKFIFFDFNGEYAQEYCISEYKKIYNLSTNKKKGCKLPISSKQLLNLEMLSIILDATDKTQRPFLGRVIRYYEYLSEIELSSAFNKDLKDALKQILLLTDKDRSHQLLDYIESIVEVSDDTLRSDIQWHDTNNYWHYTGENNEKRSAHYNNKLSDNINLELIEKTAIFKKIESYRLPAEKFLIFEKFIFLRLILDVLQFRAQNEHIAPLLGRFKNVKRDIFKIFDSDIDSENEDLWGEENIVIINLNDLNPTMTKTVPLLIAKQLYQDHKESNSEVKTEQKTILNMVIDEAHNILSRSSFREAETWKDYRLETFEEIIKEGRKFGVFLTISSQRPSDISQTITSQAHNYFIHRLINKNDLDMISKAVSYIDKNSEESIPVLPVGTCIFSGVSSQMPLKIEVTKLKDNQAPKSETAEYKF
ncbi:MAG: ATP-binding protein [Rhodomicrobiaceae bacterium]